ncbi:MAG TPA: single-stranded-DNA-specific exonuclease RecJ [Solirubrobacteraceae bacterium]|nr:single-stranded-DNA-specific exonuclease RecJ [Solirubrobacteraceae bacterium]
MDVRFDIAPYDFAAAQRLARELGVSHALAQVLVRRGLADAAAARAFLAADERHPLDAFGGLADAAAVVLGHVAAGSIITVHGDYDVDGVASTAILVRALRSLGARVDWYLPSRTEDGYGLSPATVQRLAARGTGLLLTADCAVTAVDEVAAARAAGMDVVVTDHHAPRADGRLPDAPIVHPRLGANPCPDLCAAGVAYKLAGALLEAAGLDAALADEDLDLVALATVADVVPLRGENRALVRAGLRALAATRKPGLRALMEVARVDPSGLDASAIGFRLAPRINAAGRLARADAGLELLLTGDPERARQIARELDACNHERRDVETRIRFAAEAQVAAAPGAPAYVLAGEDWHPGVIGIVAARIAERHHRPTVLVALDGDTGTGSGRSIPAFDLLGGLQAASEHLLRFGGHRAAAGMTIARDALDGFRAAFSAHAAAVLAPEDLVPVERVDAVVGGAALGLPLAEELATLEPFGAGNPPVSLLVPAASLEDPRPMGEGRHVAFSLLSGGGRSRAVRFGAGSRLPAEPGEPVDVAVRLEANAFNGTIEPRLVLRQVRRCGAAIDVLGEPPSFAAGVRAEVDRPLDPWPCAPADPGAGRGLRDVRGAGVAGTVADLVASGEPVLVLCAHAEHRARALRERVGGFALACWAALAEDPGLARPFAHLVALDPPPHAGLLELLERAPGAGWAHLAWGEPELGYAQAIHEWEYTLREPLAAVYRALRASGASRGGACEELLRGDGRQPRTAALAGRLVRVLAELELARVDGDGLGLRLVESAGRTDLERSIAYRAYRLRLEEGRRFLTSPTRAAA